MYHDKKTYVRPDTLVSELISENPPLLLMLEHFGTEPGGQGWTVTRLCSENRISEKVFITFTNIYNGFYPSSIDHLDYEDQVAFPYVSQLVSERQVRPGEGENAFSVEVYQDHHTDIEVKLADLKNLLLMHISFQQQPALRRKLLFSLFELEYDLNIHSLIEESILIPMVRKLENKGANA